MAKKKRLDTFDIVVYIILIFIGLVTIYPFINSLAISFNEGFDTMRGGISFWPRKATLDNYIVVLSNPRIYSGFKITLLRTVIGTITSVFFTGIFAYGLSKPYLKFRKFYMTLCIFTMYFSGGLIPNFILMKNLHLTNNFLVYVIPSLVNVFNMIIMVTFFKGLPVELEESAKIDGAGDFKIFFRVIFPVSIPIIAVIALFNAVGHWNSWFDAYLYVTDRELYPLQNILMDIINANNINEMLPQSQSAAANVLSNINKVTTKSITAATMMITIGPIILFYPFLQKYFVKGVMIGSVKG